MTSLDPMPSDATQLRPISSTGKKMKTSRVGDHGRIVGASRTGGNKGLDALHFGHSPSQFPIGRDPARQRYTGDSSRLRCLSDAIQQDIHHRSLKGRSNVLVAGSVRSHGMGANGCL